MTAAASIRPTKKQRELLSFIEQFIGEHGYSPSYREIMNGLQYGSVATVSLHIGNLIRRGHLRKRDRSARSLEVVSAPEATAVSDSNRDIAPGEEKWLVEKVDHFFKQLEEAAGSDIPQEALDELYVLVGSLKVLGLQGAAQSFIPRLAEISKRNA
jgi:SOS-response transcriptional repressor LexA